nr:uncharacterized protein LOC109179562 [Ipomoea batatas]
MEVPPQRRSPAELRSCIEELLRFTLKSSVDGISEVDMGLSKDYCANLLKHDPSNTLPISTDISEGVPCYPLYKHLAASLHQSIQSGTISRSCNRLPVMREADFTNQMEEECNNLVREKGSQLQNLLDTCDFDLHVQEPLFSQLKNGEKTIEGRCAVGDHKNIAVGAFILLNKCLVLQVEKVCHYSSFCKMLEVESLSKVLPGVKTTDEGVKVLRNLYSEEKEKLNGVLAICVTKPVLQPYLSMASMISDMGYRGVQALLNFAQTVGTIPEGLPPPTSTLISSFLLPHNPNVKGSRLTDGARALAKHANRSSSRYWGSLSGNDASKNIHALDVITRLITHCCWLNIHVVPPHGVVFEIRVADGYGARWSEDGSKFIGFLEPYMVDGHSKGWRH